MNKTMRKKTSSIKLKQTDLLTLAFHSAKRKKGQTTFSIGMPEGMNTPGSDLSPEDLERITMLCAHPQLLNYQRVRHTIYRTTPTA